MDGERVLAIADLVFWSTLLAVMSGTLVYLWWTDRKA